MALGQREHVEVRAPLRQALPVADPGVGHHEHPGARQVGPPAQVQVVAEEVDVVGEAAEGAEQVDADEQAGASGTQNTSRTASCCSWSSSPISAVSSVTPTRSALRPTCWSTFGRSQSTSLGPTIAGVRPVGLGDQLADRRRVERDVVVEEAEEAGALDQLHGLVGRGTEARVVAERPHERAGEALADLGHDPGLGAGDQEEQPEVGVVLAGDESRTSSNHGPGSWTTMTATTGGASPDPPPRETRPTVGSSIVTVGRG